MGEFQAGKWLIGLFIYFSIFFVITYVTISAQLDVGVVPDMETDDPGFLSQANLAYQAGGYCTGYVPEAFCSALTLPSRDNNTCIMLSEYGCSWFGTFCSGALSINFCRANMNRTVCEALECEYTNVKDSDSYKYEGDFTQDTKVLATLGAMSGFSPDLGIPSSWNWLFALIFFWIPSIMLLWSIYMSLPVIH